MIQISAKRWLAGRTLWPVDRPILASIELTQRCNLRCLSCRAWRKKDSAQDMAMDTFKRTIDNMAGLETIGLDLIGAEPTLNPHLPQMVAYAADRGFSPRLFSNGELMGRDLAHRLVDAGLHQATLSVDGACSATHDRLRGRHGCHGNVMRAIDNLVDAFGRADRVSLCMLVSRHNYRQVPDVLSLAEKKGGLRCSVHWISIVPQKVAAGRDASDQYAASGRDFLMDAQQLADAKVVFKPQSPLHGPNSLKLLRVFPKETFTQGIFPIQHCRYLNISMNINRLGKLYPCSHLRQPILGDLAHNHWHGEFQTNARSELVSALKRRLNPICAYCCHHMHNLSIGQLLKTLAGIGLRSPSVDQWGF